MRNIEELLAQNARAHCEELSLEEHLLWVDYWFNKYEDEGFATIFVSPWEGWMHRDGKHFKVINRVKPYLDKSRPMADDEADLEALPMWFIEFEDGDVIAAYPEEIIPSEMHHVR